jgi:hypothetical protein
MENNNKKRLTSIPKIENKKINKPNLERRIECAHCGKVFFAKGTRKYCKDSNCAIASKLETQKNNYSLISKLIKGYKANYKLFSKHLPEIGRICINIDTALSQGFDQNAYYGIKKNENDDQWLIVDEYAFIIQTKRGLRYIDLLKK